jgi:hypothetical protein
VITLFNRTKILTSTSMEDLGRFKMILSQNVIPYMVKVIRARSAAGAGLDARAYAQANLAYRDSHTASFVYNLYINRRDYERAKLLV